MRKPSLAVIHPQIRWGGGEAVAFWAIRALKGAYDITLVTFDYIDLAEVNKFYGLDFQEGDFKILQIPLPYRLRISSKAWLLKQHVAMRYIKKIRNQFDIIFGTFNEMDFGKPGIQYVHFPVLAEERLRDLGFINFANRWYYKNPFFRKAYHHFCMVLSGFSIEGVRQNLTLVNSQWTGKFVEEIYDIETQVVYPPVKGDFMHTPWEAREDGFVCIGRISPEKRLETIIKILSRVRERGWKVHLHIVGRAGDRNYYKTIEGMAKKNASWVVLEGSLSREEFSRLLVQHKYGIHGMQNEHFGISVAEMVKAGLIVFVPNGGGQIEIVNHKLLTFNSEQEAAKKIVRVLSDKNLQADLREHLRRRAPLFSTQRFMDKIKQVVEETMHMKKGA